MQENNMISKSVKQGRMRGLARRLKILSFEVIRRYHNMLPDFVELYAGSTKKPGPIFAKEARFFYSLARLLMPEKILEIGVGPAASAVAFAHALRDNGRGHIISVDIDEYLIERAQLILKYHGLSSFSTIIKGDSNDQETRNKVCEVAKCVDMLFIDGDHSFEVCQRDFEMYKELVSPNGVIIFHDTGPFPSSESKLVEGLPLSRSESPPVRTADGAAIYHRPDVAKVVDWITHTYRDYSLLSIHTLAEPCCGLAVLQKTQKLFREHGDFSQV
jgi:predicted O-methyltransferase YrrM